MKRKLAKSFLLIIIGALTTFNGYAQENDSSNFDKIIAFPDKLFKGIDKKTSFIERRLHRDTERYLTKLQKQEEKLKAKLLRKGDTLAALEIFGNTQAVYDELRNGVYKSQSKIATLSSYSPYVDSLSLAFQFLKKNTTLTDNKMHFAKMNGALEGINQLQSKFNQTETLRKYLQQRQRYLKEKMNQVGFFKEYKKFQKQVYYYQTQAKEYKQMFENPTRHERKILGMLSKVPAFKKYFSTNSPLGSIFQIPNSAGPSNSVSPNTSSFPTRLAVQQNLMTNIGFAPDPSQVIQQGMSNGTGFISTLKSKLLVGDGVAPSDIDMPDYKVNNQRTKSFWKRLEFGTNFQTTKASNYFPITSDLGISAAFKINDKSLIGIGTSAKIGLGRGWNNIQVTSQGVGLRSFIDIKIKGGFWASGGAEMNFRNQFSTIDLLKDYSKWQKSALLGVSKRYSLGKKLKGNAQILYDFLWKNQFPQTQPIVFRVGYHL